MTKNQQGVLQDATMADQVAAHDKAARSKRSKYVQPVPIKVRKHKGLLF